MNNTIDQISVDNIRQICLEMIDKAKAIITDLIREAKVDETVRKRIPFKS